ncbi:zinc-finger domain-containing protein [Nitrosococcus wardiae]|uniref:Zinc-finger domain-containing protein n=1 Tax=Nitrosococcus wardiae TaxID=1814290 RepID=A0A4P7BV79_9GAMM|nr:zinc-finger domain-containing protein [Nitrosococcus wardiae]QBQ53903.1 zinc-finger domain-containing protein [Nitrosococcus wardiae]
MAVSETTTSDTNTSPTHGTQANEACRYEVTRADLPLSCPMPSMELWNSHPRVYLPIEETGRERCPYCGAIYVLKD